MSKTKSGFLSLVIIIAMAFCLVILPKIESRAEAVTAEKSTTAKVALSRTKLTLTAGQCYGLKLRNSKGKVTWKSSKKTVATVSKKGRIEARKPGKAVITAIYKGKKYKCTVTVKNVKIPAFDDHDIVVCKKPVMYFYPEKDDTRISVSLDFDGKFTSVYPAFTGASEHKWDFCADRDGTLRIGSKEYGYLFWEGVPNSTYTIDTGYCVAKRYLVPFLEDKLTALGLNSKEADDFITYWLPELNRNDYNVISFDTAEYTAGAKLDVRPAPQTLIRIFMTYRGSDKPVKVKSPEAVSTPLRKGFTVVEWGGTGLGKR